MDTQQIYKTKLQFSDRKSKAEYILDKYSSLFSTSVLDVGADAMYLKPRIEELGAKYTGIGFGEGIEIERDLEQTPYPFENMSYKTVVCFDVLEHLENIHQAFDDLFRISEENVVISLPNPWSDFFGILLRGDYSEEERLKFYGLPKERPNDRHRWFFSAKEARDFVTYKAEKNGFEVIQFDAPGRERRLGGDSLKGQVARKLLKMIFRKDIADLELNYSTLWFVLKRKQ